MIKNLMIALGVIFFVLSGRSNAGLIELNFSDSIASGEFTTFSPHNQQILFSLLAPEFTVNSGDTVRATLMFQNAASFPLLFDPLSPAVGTQGRLIVADPNQPEYRAEFGFSFTFLDTIGSPILTGSEARGAQSGGDLGGGVTILQVADLDVGGLSMEFSNITNSGIGGLPVTYDGARFLVTNAVIPEPSPLTLMVFGTILGLLGYGWRRRKRI